MIMRYTIYSEKLLSAVVVETVIEEAVTVYR